ncbi:extracellular solute-binding protein [Micromonospora sp. NPDC004704]
MSSRARTAADATRSWARAHPGLSGLAFVALGLTVGLVLGIAVPPLFEPDQDLERGILRLLTSEDESEGGQRGKLIKQWDDAHPDQEVKLVTVSRSPDKAHSEMLNPIEQVDVYNLDVTWTAEFAATGRIQSLDPESLERRGLLQGFLAEPRKTAEYDGRLWALPFNTDAGLLYYRTYDRKNPETPGQRWPDPPESWADIQNRGEEALNPQDPQYDPKLEAGYAWQLVDDEILTVNALEAIWSTGGEVVNADNQVVLDSTAAEEGLRRLKDGLAVGGKPLVHPDSVDFDEKATTNAFAEGRLLAMRNWPVAYRDLTSVEAAQRVDFEVAAVPGRSVLGGQNLAVASGTRMPNAAQDLIEFLTGERSQQILFEHGGFAATRRIVYLDPNIAERYGYADDLLRAIERAGSRPVTPHYILFSKVFRDVVHQALDGDGKFTEDHVRRLTDALHGKQT